MHLYTYIHTKKQACAYSAQRKGGVEKHPGCVWMGGLLEIKKAVLVEVGAVEAEGACLRAV
eukprot:593739-Prymnesium_polylepis.1